ncbi:OmpA family protein [Catalinimonas sp. 4WD22]|uniref:OmpA family protein n=1 Tax=Catalinimonas locisalis TaxID=3133978 RepID=UPI0031018B07
MQPESPIVVDKDSKKEIEIEEKEMEKIEEELDPEPVPLTKPASVEKLDNRPMEMSSANLPKVEKKMQLAEKDKLNLEKTVRFEFQTAELDQSSKQFLNQIAEIMRSNEWLKVELIGHTCNVGTEERNKALSIERAKVVQQFLLQKNVDSSRILISGAGETQPITENTTEEGRSINRRVEFRIIEN